MSLDDLEKVAVWQSLGDQIIIKFDTLNNRVDRGELVEWRAGGWGGSRWWGGSWSGNDAQNDWLWGLIGPKKRCQF